MPFAPSSVLAPSNDARSPLAHSPQVAHLSQADAIHAWGAAGSERSFWISGPFGRCDNRLLSLKKKGMKRLAGVIKWSETVGFHGSALPE